jgi:hypothetical protein
MTVAHKTAQQVEPTEPHDPWVSLAAAAEVRGKARISVLLEALDGKIRNQKVAGRRFFHRDDLEALRKSQDAADADDDA